MYAKVKLHYIELQQRRLAALEICSTAKDMVTGPTGETRLVLPSSELRDCRPSGFRSATKCVRHLRFVYVERILNFYLGTYVGSALCTRTNRTYLWSAGQRGARPSVYQYLVPSLETRPPPSVPYAIARADN